MNETLFPTEITSRSYRRRKRIRRTVTAGVVVVVLAGGGLAVAQTTGSTPSRYRLAVAGQQEVTSTIDGVATIQPVAQADVAFPNAGTVETVSVKVGDTVTTGQALAQLNTDDLMVTVRSKEAALDQAKLVLAKAIDGDDVSSLTGGSAGRSYVLSPAAMERMLAALPATFTAADSSGLPAARQAVVSAQHAVDTAIDDAAAALNAATSVCSAIGADPTSTDPGAITSAVNACQSALNTVVSKQSAVKNAQDQLATASSALDSLLQQIADDVPDTTTAATTASSTTEPTTATTAPATSDSSTTTTEPSTATTTPSTGSVPDGATPSSTDATGGTRTGGFGGGGSSRSATTSGGGTSSKQPTASDLASYQQAVDAATSALDVAYLAVAQATITAPIDGTVVEVDIAEGDSVSAGSTTETIVIQGAGGFEATTTVSLSHVAEVHVGAAATVLPDGSTQTYSGKVVSIAATPTTASNGTTSFGVAIALDGDTSTLHNGGIGSVSIVTGTSAATLAVPTSAVTTDGTLHTVEVYDGKTVTATRVEVGVVGPVWTEITSGLTDGQQVVLAELDQALPSSATSSSNGTNGGRAITVNGRTITLPAGGFNRP
ncbi:MAG: HlyD family efflux transporter periplasmic adaptor subunit [Ilumatobacteraceae bacterium]